MKIHDVLESKGHEVVTVPPQETVLGAMRIMVEHRIGALVVTESDRIRGVISERDALRLGADDPERLADTAVAEAMTSDPIVGVPDDKLDYVMEIMTKNRIRHLPIVIDGRLAGIVSIGDVVNALRRHVEAENRHLTRYVQGMTY